jgi:MFS family permease
LLEAAVALLSERWSRRHLVGWGLCGTSAALALCALSSASAVLALGLALAGAAAGMACTAAQIELLAQSPDARERAMTRWVLCGGIGDVLTPLFVALVLELGGTYREAFWITAAWALGHGLVTLRRPARDRGVVELEAGAPQPDASAAERDAGDAAEADVPLWLALRSSAHDGRLWLALFGASLCLFLDEVVVALAALHAETALGASPSAAVACVTGASLGAVLGAGYTERLLTRSRPDRVLQGSAWASLVALLAVILAPSVLWLGLALAALGAAAAPQYALLQAKAYAAAPGRPGIVSALAHVFVVVEIGGPLLLGALADARGVAAALACLAVQPLGVLVVLLGEGWRRRSARTRASQQES